MIRPFKENRKVSPSSSLKWLAIFLISLYTSISYAQDFQQLLDGARKNSRNPDSLAYYGKLLLEEKDSLALFEGYFAVGYSFYQLGKMNEAVTYYDSALVLTNPKRYYNQYSRIKRNLAITLQRMGDIPAARTIYTEILESALESENNVQIASSYNQLGSLEVLAGNFDKGSEYFNQSIDYYNNTNAPGIVNTMLNLGTLYGRMNLLDLSNEKLEEAAEKAQSINAVVLMARCFNNISVNYRKAQKLDSSNLYLSKSLGIYRELNNQIGLVETYQNLTANFIGLEEKDSAYYYLSMAREINRQSQDLFEESRLNFVNAQLELKFGDPNNAVQLVNTSITQLLQQERIDDLRDHYELLSQAYEKAGDNNLALQILRKWKSLNDSLEIYKNIKTIEEIKEKFNTARSKQLIESERVSTSLKRNLIVVSLITLLLIIAAILIYKRYQKVKSEKMVQDEEIESLKNKLSKLSQKNRLTIAREFITLKSKALLKLNDIKFIQSDGPYLEIYLADKEKPEIERSSLKNFLEELPSEKFIQVHRSYIVNIDKIKAFYSSKIIIDDGTEITVSRSFKEEVESFLKASA